MTRNNIIACTAGVLAVTSLPTIAQDESSAATLEEVVVTAQRREESIQKSSLVIEALSAAAIDKAGITDPSSISNVVSGVNIAFAGSSVQTFIRGVGSFVTNSFADSAIAYNIDEVYISRPPAVSGVFYDLERIEVLKGPQGTLYGRNATGGAINLITKKPTHDGFGGNFALEAGDYGLIKASGALNFPVTDTFAMRAAFQVTQRDGYAADNYYDDDTRAARLHALFTPNDAVSLLFTADYAKIGGTGPIGIRIGAADPQTDDPWNDRAASVAEGQPSYLSPVPWAAALYSPDDQGFIDTELVDFSARLDWDMGIGTLTFLPAYRSMDSQTRTYQPAFLFTNDETSRQKSVELRLGNNGENIKWVGGAYYFAEDQTQFFFVDQGVNMTSVDMPKLDTESWAVFGETTFNMGSKTRGILGLRYTEEEKEQSGTQDNTTPYPTFVRDFILPSQVPPFLLSDADYVCGDAVPPFPYPVPCTLPVTGETSAAKITWKAGLEHDLTDASMLFLTVSQGFKAGGLFNTKFADPSYKPEELLAYELGSRNRFLDNSLQLNIEAFFWDYKDKQEASVRVDPLEGVGFIIRNASKAHMYGGNIDLIWQAGENDRINAGIEYLNSKYDDFVYTLNSAGNTGCVETPRVDGNFDVDCSGMQLPKAPQWSGRLGYAHTFAFSGGASLTAAARTQFSSEIFMDITYAPTAVQGSWHTYDADLTYDSPNQMWSVTAWVRNITDEVVYTGGSLYPFTPGVYYATIRPPRTFGVRVSVDF